MSYNTYYNTYYKTYLIPRTGRYGEDFKFHNV